MPGMLRITCLRYAYLQLQRLHTGIDFKLSLCSYGGTFITDPLGAATIAWPAASQRVAPLKPGGRRPF
jgi:hypothetical protein